jgi:hypothetical protein
MHDVNDVHLLLTMHYNSELIHLFSNTTLLLGLYNVSADAALAYDIAQRLMMEMMSIDGEDTEVHGTDSKLTERVQHLELRKLEELEKDSDLPSPSLDWLDDASTTDDIKLAVSSKDIEGFNFHTPQEFYTAREKEITERRLNSSTNPLEDASGTYPHVFVLKMRIRKDAIKVTKAVIVSNAGMTLDDHETKRNWNYNVDENTVRPLLVRMTTAAFLCYSLYYRQRLNLQLPSR